MTTMRNLFHLYRNDIKKTWRTINTLLSRNTSSSTPEALKINGNLITDKHAMANAFNDFFVTVGPDLAHSIPPAPKHYSAYLKNPTKSKFSFHEVSCGLRTKIITDLPAKTSVGCDGLSTKLLKIMKNELADPLSILVNQSFSSGTFPDLLKKAKVIPIFKKGDESLVTNYRPISILPALSKVFERIMHDQLTIYFENNNLINPNQYGFRKHHSTDLAASHLVDKITTRFR